MGQWAVASPPNAGRLPTACSLLLSGAVCRLWQWWLTWLDRQFGNEPGKDADSWCWLSGKLPQAPANLVQNSGFQNPLFNINLRHALLVVASKHMYFCLCFCNNPTFGKNKTGVGIIFLYFLWVLLLFLFLKIPLSLLPAGPIVCWATFPSSSACFGLCWVKWK